MLVQAIISRTETEPNRIHSERRESPTVTCLSGSIRTAKLASVWGNSFPNCACTVARSVRACPTVTPGFRRPMTVYQVACRKSANCIAVPPSVMGASVGTGVQKSTSRSGKRNEGGMTPMIEYESVPSRSRFPIAFGSAPKRLRQKRSLKMAASGPP